MEASISAIVAALTRQAHSLGNELRMRARWKRASGNKALGWELNDEETAQAFHCRFEIAQYQWFTASCPASAAGQARDARVSH